MVPVYDDLTAVSSGLLQLRFQNLTFVFVWFCCCWCCCLSTLLAHHTDVFHGLDCHKSVQIGFSWLGFAVDAKKWTRCDPLTHSLTHSRSVSFLFSPQLSFLSLFFLFKLHSMSVHDRQTDRQTKEKLTDFEMLKTNRRRHKEEKRRRHREEKRRRHRSRKQKKFYHGRCKW